MCIYWKSANVRGHGPDTSHFDDMQYRILIDIHYYITSKTNEMCATAVPRAIKYTPNIYEKYFNFY